jgi:hypothetical protein
MYCYFFFLVAFFLVPFFFAAFFFAAMQDHLLDGQTLPTIGAIVENVVGSRQKLGSGRPYASSRVHRVASIVNGCTFHATRSIFAYRVRAFRCRIER